MSKVFFAGSYPGIPNPVMSIIEGGASYSENIAVISYPTYHLDKVYFDSRFDYLNIVQQTDQSVDFPYEGVTTNCGKKSKDCSQIPRSGQRSYVLTMHGLGYVPAVLLYETYTGRAVAGTVFLQSVSSTSFRLCWLIVDAYYVYLVERWFVRTNALAAATFNFRLFIFNKPAV